MTTLTAADQHTAHVVLSAPGRDDPLLDMSIGGLLLDGLAPARIEVRVEAAVKALTGRTVAARLIPAESVGQSPQVTVTAATGLLFSGPASITAD